jgi:hypothetical protein
MLVGSPPFLASTPAETQFKVSQHFLVKFNFSKMVVIEHSDLSCQAASSDNVREIFTAVFYSFTVQFEPSAF